MNHDTRQDSGATETRSTVTHEFPKVFQYACLAVAVWATLSTVQMVWFYAQQTLVAQSQAAQAIQRAQQEAQQAQRDLQAERAKARTTPDPAKP